MTKVQCNVCGKELDEWDSQQAASINVDFCYGSKHDGEKLRCNLCCDCLDNLIDDYILPLSKIKPIINDCHQQINQ